MVVIKFVAVATALIGLSSAASFETVKWDQNHPTATKSVDHQDSYAPPAGWDHDGPDVRFNHTKLDHPHAEVHVSKRADKALGMYECAHKNFKGPCTWTRADGGKCHNWIYGAGGSMGPDKGLNCRIWAERGCDPVFKSLDNFGTPGFYDYALNTWLIDQKMLPGPMSYRCAKGSIAPPPIPP